jgi:DNA replication protein DnaC
MRGASELSRSSWCKACDAKFAHLEEIQEKTRKAQMRVQWRDHLPRLFRGKTFEKFDPEGFETVYKAVMKWVDDFPMQELPADYQSMILYSQEPGVGKTHLACAAALVLIDKWTGRVCPVRFVSGPRLLDRVYNSYKNGATETKTDILYDLKGSRLLILDDVGKEKPSEHTRLVYYELIEERMEVGWPVFITSNLPLDPGDAPVSLVDLMGAPAVSRLVGMTQGNYYELVGQDWRERNLHV